MRILLLFLVLAVASGCQRLNRTGPDDLVLTTDQARYAPGSEVRLRLVNQTDQTIGYNLCTARLERQADQGWQPAGEPDVCTAIQYGLRPGTDTTYTKTLATDLPEGTYRFGTAVEYRGTGGRASLATDPFTVAG